MFCPNCGQERANVESSFCSRCGFQLTGTAQLLETGGKVALGDNGHRGRQRGLKKGLFIFLSAFLIVPLAAAISLALGVRPWSAVIAAIILTVGGLLRMAYAWLLETDPQIAAEFTSAKTTPRGLAGQHYVPALTYPAGNWRDTDDLQINVAEGTTQHLDEKERHQ